MPYDKLPCPADPGVAAFLTGKSAQTLQLLQALLQAFNRPGPISLQATKTMIGISNGSDRIAWITQLGKNFVHVVLPFSRPYNDNLCFQKIAQVPGQQQYNHHLRILQPEDINEEVQSFIDKAYTSSGSL